MRPTYDPRHVFALLHRDGRDAGQRPAVLGDRRKVADHEHLRVAWNGQVGLDEHTPGPIHRCAERAADRCRRHAGRPEHGPGLKTFAADCTASSSTLVTVAPVRTSTPSFFSAPRANARSGWQKGGQDVRAALDQNDPRRVGMDASKVVCEGVARQLRQRPGELDAGRPAADDDERQEAPPAVGIRLQLGLLERQEHPAPDRQRIVERLEARRPLRHSSWPK